MELLSETIKLLGGLAGVVALGWRLFEEYGSYLHIALKMDGPTEKSCRVAAVTSVENKRTRQMSLSNVLLLISPETMDPVDAMQIVARTCGYAGRLDCTNDFETFELEQSAYVDGCAVIPLRYYYSENVGVGNEILAYRAPVDVDRLLIDTEYSVRLYVFGENRLHRSVQSGFYNGRHVQ